MNKVHFGLDIGTTSLKVVALKKNGNSISLDAVALTPLTGKGILSESPLDQQVLADSIKNVLSQAGIKDKEVNLAIPESSVYTKIIEMPQLSDQELSAALRWEMEQYIPMAIDQVRTDWQVLKHHDTGDKKTMDVLLVAAPFTTIQKYEAILSFAELIPATVETELISVHRALHPLVSTMPSMIVHLGATTTDIAIVREGLLNMVFSIGIGGLAITRAIALDLGIDQKQAEDYKRAYGLSREAFQGKIGKSLYPIMESIVGDIKKAMLSYKQKNNEEIQQVVLSGGNAMLPGLDVYLTNTLNTQVVIGNCWTVNNVQNVPDQIASDFSRFNVVVGLALRDIE